MQRAFTASSNIPQRYVAINLNNRLLSRSTNLCKKYKFALDGHKQTSNAQRSKVNYKLHRKGSSVVDGKVLTYFSLGNTTDPSNASIDILSPKQASYTKITQTAVEGYFSSSEAPQDIQECDIEIVHVEVASSLASATVIWQIPDNTSSKYIKEETALVIGNRLAEIDNLLPAYSSVTATPTVHFQYDVYTEREKLEEFFETLKKEHEEFNKNELNKTS